LVSFSQSDTFGILYPFPHALHPFLALARRSIMVVLKKGLCFIVGIDVGIDAIALCSRGGEFKKTIEIGMGIVLLYYGRKKSCLFLNIFH